MNLKISLENIGKLSAPSKMNHCYSYSIPATKCITGAKLAKVKNSVCAGCYALKGRFMFSNVQNALTRRYNILNEALNDKKKEKIFVESFVYALKHYEKKYKFFRWHDSGDLQSVNHLKLIAKIANLTPNIKHWIPTREYNIYNTYLKTEKQPKNLVVRVSGHMVNKPAPNSFKNVSNVLNGAKLPGFTCKANENYLKPGETCKKCGTKLSKGGVHCCTCTACWDPKVKTINYYYH
tara:strand:+ start:459 stop:1166 length:708 start_codon:yes stop_codon:yes gene_type:complete